jgi:hypothetical protein
MNAKVGTQNAEPHGPVSALPFRVPTSAFRVGGVR